MKNGVRIQCDQNLVTNAAVELRGPNEEWVDIRHWVQTATVTLEVGSISRAHLDLIFIDANVEAFRLDQATQEAFAHQLREHGWTVTNE